MRAAMSGMVSAAGGPAGGGASGASDFSPQPSSHLAWSRQLSQGWRPLGLLHAHPLLVLALHRAPAAWASTWMR